jgi:hypothetical protein
MNASNQKVSTRVYPKYSGLVPPSIQQLWYREAPVHGRTTMSSESLCQVARGRGQFSHAFSGEVYDFYSVSPEYFGYTIVCCTDARPKRLESFKQQSHHRTYGLNPPCSSSGPADALCNFTFEPATASPCLDSANQPSACSQRPPMDTAQLQCYPLPIHLQPAPNGPRWSLHNCTVTLCQPTFSLLPTAPGGHCTTALLLSANPPSACSQRPPMDTAHLHCYPLPTHLQPAPNAPGGHCTPALSPLRALQRPVHQL